MGKAFFVARILSFVKRELQKNKYYYVNIKSIIFISHLPSRIRK